MHRRQKNNKRRRGVALKEIVSISVREMKDDIRRRRRARGKYGIGSIARANGKIQRERERRANTFADEAR